MTQSGVVNADIFTQIITIEGVVSGSIVASEKVEILPGGSVIGKIKTPNFIANKGALLQGDVDMNLATDKVSSFKESLADIYATIRSFKQSFAIGGIRSLAWKFTAQERTNSQ